jgi:ABC-type antimicrobial peptide transport system permease subunit
VAQFSVACVLIASTLIIHLQIRHAQGRETGFDKDQLIYIPVFGDNAELIKQDLLSSGTALSVTKTAASMSRGWNSALGINWQGRKDSEASIAFDLYSADVDWTKTVGTTIVEGRDIDIHTYQTDSTAMLINEAALKIMNLDNPVGEVVNAMGRDWHVVGVVKDFIFRSPYDPIEPMLISGPAGILNTMHIKLNGQNRMTDNLARVEQTFRRYNPANLFEYGFIDEEYARKFSNELKIGTLATWFAILTIFISCMGLFALVAYMAETRKKEIGIRKVLGASVSNIMVLLSKEFMILVTISFVVGSPIAWWGMKKWLAGYAYHTSIPWWLFVVVGVLSICIALLTVGFQAIRAATANPVESIKSE